MLADSTGFSSAAYWSHAGETLVGHGGVRILVRGPQRLATLSRLWRHLAGALPGEQLTAFVSSVFDDASATPSVLHVPGILRRRQGEGWVQVQQKVPQDALERALDDEPNAAVAHGTPAQALAPAAASSQVTAQQYCANVDAALAAIRTGSVVKVVLARDEVLPGSDATWYRALAMLQAQYRDCYTFAVAGLFGATPELLVSKDGERVASRVLAGSLPRGGEAEDVLARRLRTDKRLAAEHFFAADSVGSRLATRARLDECSPQPFVLTLPNILHLATDYVGTVIDPATTVLELVELIHPTAAVAGTPQDAAMQVIRDIEHADRGRYAGPVGWMDAVGNGKIALALRCGQVEDGAARLFAGGGIVAGADSDAELAETVSKLLPMRRALGA